MPFQLPFPADFIRNFPFFSIIISLFSGSICSMLSGKVAKYVNTAVIIICGVLSGFVFWYTWWTGGSFVYYMGHFPAPWGNEIRAGVLEGGLALFFCVIMLLAMLGGRHKLDEEVDLEKHNLYYILVNLLLCSLLALVYTNDLFTAYVFVEINTIASCGLIMIRQIGRTLEAAVRYMIMSLIGSGLLLMGLCMVYDLTGHLLMSSIKESMVQVVKSGLYPIPLAMTILLMTTGLAIKSALFPFHAWLPDAYGYSTISSAAMLSSLVSKGYIFLLIKIIYRVIGFEIFMSSGIKDILYIFGLMGMIFGSTSAIKETDIRRMIAFSSVAQIGYIYMGMGLGSQVGMVASVYHIFGHAAGKALLFISVIGLTDASGFSRNFFEMTGSGYRNKIAGVGFAVGALSMTGVPVFAGFVSKMLFAQAAVQNPHRVLPTMIVLAISTIFNAIYFLKTVIRIYTPDPFSRYGSISIGERKGYAIAIVLFIAVNIGLGMSSQPVVDAIKTGLEMFG